MPELRSLIIFVVTATVAAGCGPIMRAQHPEPLASHIRAVASEVEACLREIQNSLSHTGQELDSDRIRLISWNAKKGASADWHDDFSALAAGQDLVLIQEAIWHPDSAFEEHHWAFAPGYRNRKHQSGVMTYSNSEPLAQCNLISWEPWLGTPKATNITEYGLTGTDQTVLVVNIHAINFTLGVDAFSQQLERISPIFAAHPGPIILSGDFNTWRKRRAEVLDAFADGFSLTPVEFQDDHRKVFFGQPLDHIFVRGLRVGISDTRQITSSDHNPLLVEFSL